MHSHCISFSAYSRHILHSAFVDGIILWSSRQQAVKRALRETGTG